MKTANDLDAKVEDSFTHTLIDVGKMFWRDGIKPGAFVNITEKQADEEGLGKLERIPLYAAAYLVEIGKNSLYGYGIYKGVIEPLISKL